MESKSTHPFSGGGGEINKSMALNLVMGAVGIVLWGTIYRLLPDLSSWLTYSLLWMKQGSHLGASVEFFLYDTPKVMMLLVLIVFCVGIIRSFFTPEKTYGRSSSRLPEKPLKHNFVLDPHVVVIFFLTHSWHFGIVPL